MTYFHTIGVPCSTFSQMLALFWVHLHAFSNANYEQEAGEIQVLAPNVSTAASQNYVKLTFL